MLHGPSFCQNISLFRFISLGSTPTAMLLSQKYFQGGLKRVNLGDWMNKTENQI